MRPQEQEDFFHNKSDRRGKIVIGVVMLALIIVALLAFRVPQKLLGDAAAPAAQAQQK